MEEGRKRENMQELTLEELLAAGAHFGHKVSRWNPKMAPYIFTVRNKFHVIDLEKTRQKISEAQDYVVNLVKGGGTVLFVGTKRQARTIIKKQAIACGMPFVVTRWLGGTLTNFRTIQRSIKKLASREELLASEKVKNYTKKERLMMQREVAKSKLLFEGIRDLKKLPDAIFVIDTNGENIAVREAGDCGIKIIGIVDTNSDPSVIDFPIPANDDAIKTLEIIIKSIAAAVEKGRPTAGPGETDQAKTDDQSKGADQKT